LTSLTFVVYFEMLTDLVFCVILAVGPGSAAAPGGPALVYPQGFVFASSASSLSGDGYVFGIPNSHAFAISSDGVSVPGN
jgi:hypothetical protein